MVLRTNDTPCPRFAIRSYTLKKFETHCEQFVQNTFIKKRLKAFSPRQERTSPQFRPLNIEIKELCHCALLIFFKQHDDLLVELYFVSMEMGA